MPALTQAEQDHRNDVTEQAKKFEHMTEDQLLQEVAERMDAIQNATNPKTETQFDEVSLDIEALLQNMVTAGVEKKVSEMPLFKQGLAPNTFESRLGDIQNNRYLFAAKEIYENGAAPWGSKQVTATDLWMAGLIIDSSHSAFPNEVKPMSDDLRAVNHALSPGNAGAGAELIAETRAGFLWPDIHLASRVWSNLGPPIDPMPTDPYPIPLSMGPLKFRKLGTNQPTTPQDPTTAESVLRTTEIGVEINWPYDMDEDAVVAMMPNIRAEVTRAAAEDLDDFTLNADKTITATGNINSDDAAPAADNLYLVLGDDGIRHQWLVDNTAMTVAAGGDALDDADIIAAMGKLDKYASDPGKLLTFMDIQTYLVGFLALDEVKTVDKFGVGAVVKTGQIGSYRGLPLIVSASHRLAAADGKVNSVTGNTLGSMSVMHEDMWTLGLKRSLLIEVATDIRTRQTILVASMRPAITNRGAVASNIHTAGIANILV